MRLAEFEGDRNLAALARRVYRISGETRALEAVLVAANPGLAKMEELPRGATILVPEVAGIPLREGASKDAIWPIREAAARLTSEGLKQLQETLKASAQRKAELATEARDVMRGKEMTRTLSTLPMLKGRVSAAREQAQGELRELEKTSRFQSEVLARIERLMKAALGTGA